MVIITGSLNADLVARVSRAPSAGETLTGMDFNIFPGGKGANQANAVGHLGGKARMIGCIGDDTNGQMLIKQLAVVGVDTDLVEVCPNTSSGTAIILVEESGQNRIVVIPASNQLLSPERIHAKAEHYSDAAVALFQLETPIETVTEGLALAKSKGAITILDPAPAQELSKDLLKTVDYLTPNLSELSLLSKTLLDDDTEEAAIEGAARKLLSNGTSNILVKMGSRGALLVSQTAVQKFAPYKVKAIDTTAAGDCFNGAFATALDSGKSVVESIKFACAASAISVTRKGAQPSMPSLEEVELFLQN
jgi:ribokinase